jgi:hypothetical protein
MIVHEADSYNAKPPPAALDDLPLTPMDAFYARNHGPIPHIDAETWRLKIGGPGAEATSCRGPRLGRFWDCSARVRASSLAA